MEEKTRPPTATPIADVAPPRAPDDVRPAPPADSIDPREDVKAPAESKDLPKAKAKQQPASKKPGGPGSGVGMAVTATVVIVLGLAAMATYAFLKTR